MKRQVLPLYRPWTY